MATGTITIRLPEETIEKLQGLAESQRKSVSVLARDMIVAAMETAATGTGGNQNALVVEYLEGFGAILMALVHESVGARYFAEMATNYATDMESLLREKTVMDPEAKKALLSRFEQAAQRAGQEAWIKVLGLQGKTDER